MEERVQSVGGVIRGSLVVACLLIACICNLGVHAQTLTVLAVNVGGPQDGLILANDGNLYGTIPGGVFRITPSGFLTPLCSFDPSDGTDSYAPVVQALDGNFYGTTEFGADGWGTIFRMAPDGSLTNVFVFTGYNSGGQPMSGLVQGGDSNLYGTTQESLVNDGTVYRIDPQGDFTNLCLFGGGSTLILGQDGALYGTTFEGGSRGYGSVFSVTTNGVPTTLWSFTPGNDGGFPMAGVVEGNDGSFYGTTTASGQYNQGTVFRITASGELSTLWSFTGGDDGGSPVGGLIQGHDGYFYGTTSSGGSGGGGTIYRITSYGGLITLYSFSGSDGASPKGALLEYTNGVFYGTTSAGNTNNAGIVFRLDVGTNECPVSLSGTNVNFSAKGGTDAIKVATRGSDCSWTPISNAPFITIVDGTISTGSGEVHLTVPGNTNAAARSGTVTLAGQTITVNQAAGGCVYKLSPKKARIKAAGGSFTVKVKSNLNDCEWTAVSNDSFITITGGVNGVGSGTVTYTVPANTGTTALTGSITIAGETFTLTQAGVK